MSFMSTTIQTSNPLMARLFPALQNLSLLKGMVLALLGTAVLTLSAKISIPFYPVPTTLQPFAVIALGCLYGSRLATATVGLYLLEGAMGLPVFHGPTAGLIYFTGPTAGYLLGFLVTAYSVGRLFEKGFGHSFGSALLLFTLGAVLMDIPGVLWLSNLVGFKAATAVYLNYQYAFLLKTVLGALMIPALHHHHSKKKTN